MKRKLTLILLLLAGSLTGSCQVSVTGIVVSKGDQQEIPGVRVTEKGTENETFTDINGKFFIKVSGPDAILVFAFFGMVGKEISLKGQNDIIVQMKSDCIKDNFDHQRIGLLAISGLVNTPVGGQFEFSFPPFLRSTTLKTAISYQTNLRANEFLNSDVEFNHVIFKCDFEMDLKWQYKKVYFNNDFKSTACSFESVLMFDFLNPVYIYNPGLIVGFEELTHKDPGIYDKQVTNGPVLGLRANLGRLYNSELYAKVGILKDMPEYQGQVRIDFRKIATFIRFYKIDTYTELSVGLGISTGYRLKTKKNKAT